MHADLICMHALRRVRVGAMQVAVEGRRVIAFTLRYLDDRQLWDAGGSDPDFAGAVVRKLDQVRKRALKRALACLTGCKDRGRSSPKDWLAGTWA